MATLSSEFSSRLNLKTKTVGANRIRKAKENNEDIAVLSMFLPGTAAVEENSRFRCALGIDCRLGDWRLATPGILFSFSHLCIYVFNTIDTKNNNNKKRIEIGSGNNICT